MEADTVHALVECKTKQKKLPPLTILTPHDWQNVNSQMSKKFTVHNMELPEFKNFKSLYNEGDFPMVYRKTDVNKEKLQLSLCIHLQVIQEKIDLLYYNISSENDFKEVDLKRNTRKALEFHQL
ncbi:hypothetical protein AVEN_116385-1 [Araneus ventricosus]|uniref:Uncharacterized protein n=1 Tax=Araneus ventricosus TaxID=182803 RepID=A0A4Y2KRP8_ARAVE|nr:hypothetical protein AVEN_116385-1 [Araneus ventricosus]